MKRKRLETSVNFPEVLSCRVSKSDFDNVVKKATQANLKTSAFVRSCVLTNKTSIIAKKTVSLEKKRMQFVFNKTGNNMNQIAHALNAASLAGILSGSHLLKALSDLERIRDYLKAALHHVD